MARYAWLIGLIGISCSPAPAANEPAPQCGPSSCPMPHQTPPSAPEPDGVCNRAIVNMTRIGLFRLAEVDPPRNPIEQKFFCEELEKRGYDLECMANARSVIEAGRCRNVPNV